MQDLPQQADSIEIALSDRNTVRNQDTARQKEREYLKKAMDQFNEEMRSQRGAQLLSMQKQHRLDAIYFELCKDYTAKKKEQVKVFKQNYITEMSAIVQKYNEVGALPFIKWFLP